MGTDTIEIEWGSIAAQARYHIWSGVGAVVVAAPPGAGKTTLLVQVLPELISGADLHVAVAGQTRTQSVDVANRLEKAMPGQVAVLASSRDKIKNSTGLYLKRPKNLDDGVHFVANVDQAHQKGAKAIVATAAKWKYFRHENSIIDFDLLVIDESWQSTYADVREMGGIAPQILMVGDPGQIAPVVSADTSLFAGAKYAPHLPAPDRIVEQFPENVVKLQMPQTYRCGPKTTEVLQSLYPFTFTSGRNDQHIQIDGKDLPEISVHSTEAGSQNDSRLFDLVAEQVIIAASKGMHFVDGEERKIDPSMIAVGVAHVHQTLQVIARLPEELKGVTVDTLERLQGLEFAHTTLLDPMAGLKEITEHNSDLGRLCVGLSRSTAHTAFVTTDQVIEILSEDPDNAQAALGVEIRKALFAA